MSYPVIIYLENPWAIYVYELVGKTCEHFGCVYNIEIMKRWVTLAFF